MCSKVHCFFFFFGIPKYFILSISFSQNFSVYVDLQLQRIQFLLLAINHRQYAIWYILLTLNVYYRVIHPSCHPLISLWTRIQKKNRVLNWQPPKNGKVQILPPLIMAESRNFVCLRVASSGVSNYFGGKFWILPFLGVASSGLWLWILAHREIRGRQHHVFNMLYM